MIPPAPLNRVVALLRAGEPRLVIRRLQKAPENFINWEKQIERRKSSVRSKVEHPFLRVKRFFGYSKTVYKGLAKNGHRLYMLFTSTNMLM